MKEVVARIEGEDLDDWRDAEADLEILRSGAVHMSYTEAYDIVRRERALWRKAARQFGLEDDEFYVFDPVFGTISVDKSE